MSQRVTKFTACHALLVFFACDDPIQLHVTPDAGFAADALPPDSGICTTFTSTTCGPDMTKLHRPCRRGRTKCVGHDFIRGEPIVDCKWAVWPSEEVCDGVDNSCDGVVDGHFDSTDDSALAVVPLVGDLCYSGDHNNLLCGECRAGVEQCIRGQWECTGERLPETERCNDKDDDCDCQVDEGLAPQNVKVCAHLIVDTSGSMCPFHSTIRDAVRQIQTGPDVLWNITALPGEVDNTHQTLATLVPTSSLTDVLNRPFCFGGGYEPSYDALINAPPCQEGAELIVHFLFIDEAGQSAQGYTEFDVVDALDDRGEIVYIFQAGNDAGFHMSYDDIVLQTNGAFYRLTNTDYVSQILSEETMQCR